MTLHFKTYRRVTDGDGILIRTGSANSPAGFPTFHRHDGAEQRDAEPRSRRHPRRQLSAKVRVAQRASREGAIDAAVAPRASSRRMQLPWRPSLLTPIARRKRGRKRGSPSTHGEGPGESGINPLLWSRESGEGGSGAFNAFRVLLAPLPFSRDSLKATFHGGGIFSACLRPASWGAILFGKETAPGT